MTGTTDWVFDDARFGLKDGPDEVFLGFLARMVHPAVKSDTQRAEEVVAGLNRLLAPDGWMLKPFKQISGRPVYAPARTGTGDGVAVSFAREIATRVDAEYISQQLTRMEGAVDTDRSSRSALRKNSSRPSVRRSSTNAKKNTRRRTTYQR
ncbi:MAG: hypothetical protein ACRDRS_24590 [Pseudonocardiaceae bacterium]